MLLSMFKGIKDGVKVASRRFSKYYVDVREVKSKAQRLLSEQGSTLDRQGFIQGTDKASIINRRNMCELAHDYLRHYDFLFQAFRADKFSLIEFGCLEGASLRTWEQYFPNAEIYGVDLDESAKQHEKGRVHIVIGDATSQHTYDTLKAETGGAFIILDDASHAWSDQRRSFELFWDMLTPGGFYVIEDLECPSLGAFPEYPPKVLDAQPFYSYMQDRCEYLRWASDRNPEENSYHFEQLPAHIQKIQREMDMCIFIPGTIIVRKKPEC